MIWDVPESLTVLGGNLWIGWFTTISVPVSCIIELIWRP